MASSLWVAIVVIATCAIVTNGIVKIITTAKSSGGQAGSRKFANLETDLESLGADLEDARERIEVLEKIVTNEKYDLDKKIDALAN